MKIARMSKIILWALFLILIILLFMWAATKKAAREICHNYSCAKEIATSCSDDDLYRVKFCIEDGQLCDKVFLDKVDQNCLKAVQKYINFNNKDIGTDKIQTCDLAKNKNKLRQDINLDDCKKALQTSCKKNDIYHINTCLADSLFCRKFFFDQISQTCLELAKKYLIIFDNIK